MRSSFATAACIVFVASLAGCSTLSQGTPAVPSSSDASSAGPAKYPVNPFAGIRGKLTPEKMLKLQLQGRMPMSAPRKVLEYQLQAFRRRGVRPHLRFNPNHTPAIWATNSNYSYLV